MTDSSPSPIPIPINSHDVVATQKSEFINHVAISCESSNTHSCCKVWHVRPPLVNDVLENSCATRRLTDLNSDEKKILDLRIYETKKQMVNQNPSRIPYRDYSIVPAVNELRDKENGAITKITFSCVGFVVYIFRALKIDVLPPEGSLPKIELAALKEIYPDLPTERTFMLKRLGLDGNGPWRVALAGYVLHSFSREDCAIRAAPPSDIEFSHSKAIHYIEP